MSPAATAEMVIGLLIPLGILLTPEFATSGPWLFWSSILVIVGLFLNRLNVSVIGITSEYGRTYYPHWMEIAISAGIVSAGILVYIYVCRNFPVYSHESEPASGR